MDHSENSSMTIYSLDKSGKIIEQCKVQETRYNLQHSSFSISLIELDNQLVHMREYLQELFELIMKYEVDVSYEKEIRYKTKKYIFGRDRFGQEQYATAIIFNKVNMRKGTYFYILQQSEKKVRFLLYALDRQHHSSDCLGATMRIPIPSNCIKDMRDKLLKFTIKQVHDLNINNFMELVENDNSFFI